MIGSKGRRGSTGSKGESRLIKDGFLMSRGPYDSLRFLFSAGCRLMVELVPTGGKLPRMSVADGADSCAADVKCSVECVFAPDVAERKHLRANVTREH